MTILKPFRELWKKDSIYLSNYHKDKIYRSGIPEENDSSFYLSLEYGPKFYSSVLPNKRISNIQTIKKLLAERMNISSFLKLQDGHIFLQRMKEVMKDVHYHLPKMMENEDTKLQFKLYNINPILLDVLVDLVPKNILEEKLLQKFILFCSEKNLKVFNEEQRYLEIQKVYTMIYETIIREQFQILLNKQQITNTEKVDIFISLLVKTTQKLFDYICDKNLNEFKNDIENEWLDIFQYFYLNECCLKDYNLIIIDGTTKKLYDEIDQKQFIDSNKKCKVLLYYPDHHFEPVHIESINDEIGNYIVGEDVELGQRDRKQLIKYFYFDLDHPFIESILNSKY